MDDLFIMDIRKRIRQGDAPLYCLENRGLSSPLRVPIPDGRQHGQTHMKHLPAGKSGFEISVSDLANGMYYLNIKSDGSLESLPFQVLGH